MDMLGVNKLMMKSKKHSNKRCEKKEIKVTYISSPMKVKTSASNFRALVQELTGLDSNVAEMIFMEEATYNGGENDVHSVNYRGFDQQWRLGAADEGFVAEEASCLKPDYSIDDHHVHSRSFVEMIFMEEATNNGGENDVHSVNYRGFDQQWRLGAADEGFVAEEASCLKPDYSIDDHHVHSRSFVEVPLVNYQYLQCDDLLSIDYLL